MALLEESGHGEWWWPPVCWVVPNRQGLQRLAGLHPANVQCRDLNRLAWQLLVSQVLIQEAVQTLVDLFQIHLFVLKMNGKEDGAKECVWYKRSQQREDLM